MSISRRTVPGLALAVAVLATGCSSAPVVVAPSPPSHGPGSSAARRSSSAPAVTQPTALPAHVPNTVGLISEGKVALTSCAATTHGWRATGTAQPVGAATRYTVTLYFTTAQATVEAFAQTTVHLVAGRPAPWAVARTFPAAAGTRCVIAGAG